MKIAFEPKELDFLYMVCNDCEQEATKKGDKKIRKYANKLKSKFTPNATYSDLSRLEAYELKEICKHSVSVLESTVKVCLQRIELSEDQDAVNVLQNKINAANEQLEVSRELLKTFNIVTGADARKTTN